MRIADLEVDQAELTTQQLEIRIEEQAFELDELRREWQTSEGLLAGSQRYVLDMT